jgi:hypothetical protein
MPYRDGPRRPTLCQNKWDSFLSILLGVECLGAGLVGWRRSADRTSLQANSLVSGNFTGNFAILGPRDTI